jgi:hypothetical protein
MKPLRSSGYIRETSTMTNPDKPAAEYAAESTPPMVTKEGDLEAFRAAVVDAASVSGGLWFTYLSVLLYLLIAVGSVTNKDLFLESPIKLPFMNVDLP